MEMLSFKEIQISEDIKRAVEEMGFENATEIQAKAIPAIKEGLDVIGKSQTGTGKTVAFGIPALETIDPSLKEVQVLVLCPTRELAMQACEEMRKLSKFKEGIKIVDVYGGAPMGRQIERLKSANIVIGTPGRIMDHMRRRTLKLFDLKMVVLDEADEMLSMGFREDIESILEEAPEERQTVLFSATMPREIMELTRKFQNNPKLISVEKKQMTVENIDQFYYNVPMGRKMDALNLILSYTKPKRAILFCNTKKMVDDISGYLKKYDFSAEGIHGDMKQAQRTKVMNSFKKGQTNILIATDVAARGIDVSDIDYVINYDIPQNIEYYVHRIGRTGRAGKSGIAITICSGSRQVEVLQKIARFTKSKITFDEIPSLESVNKKNNDLVIKRIEDMVKENTDLNYMDTINELVKRGYDPACVAAAVLEVHFGKIRCSISDVKSVKPTKIDKDNSPFKKVILTIGRNKKVAPAHVVAAISEKTSVRGSEIGKIEIYDKETIVSVPAKKLDEVLKKMKNSKICGKTVTVKENRSAFDDVYDVYKDYRNLKRKRLNKRRKR